jgi:ferredoxin
MRIKIDQRKCQGFGMCQEVAPTLFKVDERDGHSVALVAEVPPADTETAKTAVEACPMSAIALE